MSVLGADMDIGFPNIGLSIQTQSENIICLGSGYIFNSFIKPRTHFLFTIYWKSFPAESSFQSDYKTFPIKTCFLQISCSMLQKAV